MEETNAKIIFSDGTELNTDVNGSCFIVDSKPDFPDNLSDIQIVKGDNKEAIDYGMIIEAAGIDNRYWFSIIEIPESERAAKQIRSDVDFIAMELDIDL